MCSGKEISVRLLELSEELHNQANFIAKSDSVGAINVHILANKVEDCSFELMWIERRKEDYDE